jgi:tetratricopeptide (TPR) repeat protein
MPATVPLSGKLEENTFPGLLNHLHEIKGSGTLSLVRESLSKKLYFKNGDIVFASSGYEGDRLGEALLRAGKINVKQFDAASKVVRQTGKRVGGVLVELGFLKPKDLFWGVKFQVQEIVYSLFVWTEGEYEFNPGELPATEVITLHMSTANLILQGVKRIDDWTRISRGIPPMDTVLRLTDNPLKLYQNVDMSEDEKKVVSFFDGKRSIKEVFGQVNVGDFEALKAVYVFYSIGLLEDASGPKADKKLKAVPEPAYAAMPGLDRVRIHKAYIDAKGQNYYELLGLDSEATVDEVEPAYQRLARLYHPDQQYRKGMEELSGELEELVGRVTEAYTILSDDSRRWEYDLSLATVMGGPGAAPRKVQKPKDAAGAKEAFSKGIDSFKKREFESATVHFKEAVRLDASNATYFSHLALALLQRPKREAEAEEAMLAAIELDPHCADHRANLGLLYQKAGMKGKSKEAFEEALLLEPGNVKALKALGMQKQANTQQ